MTSVVQDVLIGLASSLLTFLCTVAGVWARRKIREKATHRAVREFFGLPGAILVVHSAIFDADEQAFNYPATDTRAARALAQLFESVGLREGVDFTVHPDRRVPLDDSTWSCNLVLLCGPARNAVLAEIGPALSMRYTMTAETVGGRCRNVLTDHRRNERLRSSREGRTDIPPSGYDWGLVASLPNPRNPARRVVILAGIHGTGTVGAAEFVTDRSNLKLLNGRRRLATVSEVLRVDYGNGDIETPTSTELA